MRILLIGNSPLPSEDTASRPAAGLRTNQFLQPLRAEGHTVRLITIAMPECYINQGIPDSETVISKDDPHLIYKVQRVCDEVRPDVIVGVNTFPASIAARLKSGVPMWADLNGWILAEAEAQAFSMGSNDYLSHYMGMERAILARADQFSGVSLAQCHAILGELGVLGRLGKDTFGKVPVHHIPNATEDFPGEREEDTALSSQAEKLFSEVPHDAFVALWMGGYNTWVDENTLFRGVEAAMRECSELYYVSTGGAIKGLNDHTFTRFLAMIEESEFRKRFVFLGWVESSVIPYIYRRALVGLNVDHMCVETVMGARNRINEMMKYSLPVVTTLGSEISYAVARVGAGVGVESGNSDALCEALMSLYKGDREVLAEYGKRGREYILHSCNYSTTTKPLLAWLAKPEKLPLAGRRSSVRGVLRYWREHGLRKLLKKVWQRMRG